MKYRELARVFHPDADTGDSVRMEEVNHAYKLLMKEGGYERLHLPSGADGVTSTSSVGGSPTRSERRGQTVAAPFTLDQQSGDGRRTASTSSLPHLTDEEVEKYGALDPSTERRTQDGKYLYQNRDDQSWVTLDHPLLRTTQPSYASFAAQSDMAAELRRRAVLREVEENEKSLFQKTIDRLADSADLPTRNPYLLRLYSVLILGVFYLMYFKTFERTKHHKKRHLFYSELEKDREVLMQIYDDHKDGLEVSVVAAAVLFVAAAKAKVREDAEVAMREETFYRSVNPPAEHFNIIAGG